MATKINVFFLLLLFLINCGCTSKIENINMILNCTVNEQFIVFSYKSSYLILDFYSNTFKFKPESDRYESRGKFKDIYNVLLVKEKDMYLFYIGFKQDYLDSIVDKKYAKKLIQYKLGKITLNCKNKIKGFYGKIPYKEE